MKNRDPWEYLLLFLLVVTFVLSVYIIVIGQQLEHGVRTDYPLTTIKL